jgi:NAD-dependent SIR2 family protein deacetylase
MGVPDADRSQQLAELFACGDALVLTGAGISTDSGIPDYRGPDGRPRNAAPMTFQRFTGSIEERRRYWARSHLGWPRIAAAKPNVSHQAVADLGRAGLLTATVTQNVDGLHTAAGTPHVIDLHGRLDRVVCLDCGRRRPRLEVALRLDAVNPGFRRDELAEVALRPDGDIALADERAARFRLVACRPCGGTLKPDVTYFGEHVPPARFRHALGLLDRSSSLVVLGSSLAVGSGYRFVTAAVRRGLPIAIVTRGVTRADRHATLRLDAPLAEVLPDVAAAACASRAPADRAPVAAQADAAQARVGAEREAAQPRVGVGVVVAVGVVVWW